MTTDEVLSNPAYKNFHFDIEEVYSVDSEEGLIIDQSPKAPKSVKENAHITLKVSLGAEEVTVPNVVGWQRDTVRAKFKELVDYAFLLLNGALEKKLLVSTNDTHRQLAGSLAGNLLFALCSAAG